MTIYDITRPISPGMAVWPGDTPYSHRWVMRIANGDSVNVSTLTMSAHTGTHVDGPYHFDDQGITIDQMPLDAYWGHATVIQLDFTGPILPDHLIGLPLDRCQRLLVRTPASLRGHGTWEDDIAYLTPETAALLGEHRLRLFGTDAPSVDPIHSETLDAHRILHHCGVAILENAYLASVPPGEYELVALPLAVPLDGSPVRAILRTIHDT